MSQKLIRKINRALIILLIMGIVTLFLPADSSVFALVFLAIISGLLINPLSRLFKIDNIVAKNFFE